MRVRAGLDVAVGLGVKVGVVGVEVETEGDQTWQEVVDKDGEKEGGRVNLWVEGEGWRTTEQACRY